MTCDPSPAYVSVRPFWTSSEEDRGLISELAQASRIFKDLRAEIHGFPAVLDSSDW